MGVFSGWQSAATSAAQTVANLVGQTIVANRFLTSLTGATGVVWGNTAQTVGIGLDTGTASVEIISASAAQWRLNGSTGDWQSSLGRNVITTGQGSFGGLTLGSTDTSGTPGNAVANTASGRSAIAAGASSCVISNTIVTAGARIFISPKIRDATGLLPIVSAQVAATSFTVSTTANCTANLTFDWWVLV